MEGRATGLPIDPPKPLSNGSIPKDSSNNGSGGGMMAVAVKVLREDATDTEQMYFLNELRPYRDLSHPNILKVLAACLDTEPFLILLQLCSKVRNYIAIYF